MGAPAIRITADDFLTPPEFRGLRLAGDPAGRVGGVRAELVADPAGARLGTCYQQVPLRTVPPFHFGPGRPALLYLLNPTAGLMDGDGQLVELTARDGARAIVAGQSATRIHPCLHGFAAQRWRLRVEAGAVLAVLPGPAIPFAGCRYSQRVDVDLEPGAGFVWGDVRLPGRYARGACSERFGFECVVQEMTVRRDGRLVFRDRYSWHGPWDEHASRWHFGGGTAAGSLFATGCCGDRAFRTAAGDTCLRYCGPAEEVTARVVAAALTTAAALDGGTGAGPWIPAGSLAPSHWFSPVPGLERNPSDCGS